MSEQEARSAAGATGRHDEARSAAGATRTRIVAEAITWLGTPYHHQASQKGVGCDCLGLVRGVWREVYDAEPERPPPYARDWRAGEETLLTAARRHLVDIPVADAREGDVVLFRYRRQLPVRHAGILVDPGGERFIHAWDAAPAVVMTTLTSRWRRRIAAAFAFPDVVVDNKRRGRPLGSRLRARAQAPAGQGRKENR